MPEACAKRETVLGDPAGQNYIQSLALQVRRQVNIAQVSDFGSVYER